MDFHYVQIQRKVHCVGKSSYHLMAVLEFVETLGRTVYIVIFPDKCIQGTYASECRPMFLTWFLANLKSGHAFLHGFLVYLRIEEKGSDFQAD